MPVNFRGAGGAAARGGRGGVPSLEGICLGIKVAWQELSANIGYVSAGR